MKAAMASGAEVAVIPELEITLPEWPQNESGL